MKNIHYLLAMMSGVLPEHMKSLPAKKRKSTWSTPHQGKQECARRVRQSHTSKAVWHLVGTQVVNGWSK